MAPRQEADVLAGTCRCILYLASPALDALADQQTLQFNEELGLLFKCTGAVAAAPAARMLYRLRSFSPFLRWSGVRESGGRQVGRHTGMYLPKRGDVVFVELSNLGRRNQRERKVLDDWDTYELGSK